MINEISVSEVKKRLDEGHEILLLDVRTKEEFDEGHIMGAINIDVMEIGDSVQKKLKDKTAEIIVYCRSGHRSEIAVEMMLAMEYAKVKNMIGGLIDWVEKKYQLVT